MPETVNLKIDGVSVEAPAGATVAAVLLMHGEACRTSVTGERRGSLCGMGVCYECRVTIDGIPDRLACQTRCAPGMEVRTHG